MGVERRLLVLVALAVLGAVGGAPAGAEPGRVLYQWTDGDGVVRYTAQETRVPESARAETLVIREDASGALQVARWGEEPVVVLASAAAEPAPVDAAPPALEPPPPLPAAGGEAYAVQLGSHSLSDWVRPLAGSQVLEGRALYRTTVTLDGVLWERLRLGFFASLVEARAAQAQVAPHFADAWIVRAEPDERSASLEGGIAAPGRAPRPVAPAADAGGAGWVVQLAARPLLDGLRDLTRLDLLGRHHVYLSTADVDGETWERLRLGFFPTHESADAVLRELVGSHPDAWVAQVDPEEREGSTLLD